MDWKTVAIVAVPNAVAVAAIYFGYRQQRKTLEHNRGLHDLEDLRTLLDAAAALLHRISYAMDRLRADLNATGATLLRDKRRDEHLAELEALGVEADELTERLAIRLGRDAPAASTFAVANNATLDAFRAVQRIQWAATGDPENPSPEDVDEARLMAQEARAGVVGKEREQFDTAREEFIAAAHAAVGSVLPAG